MDKTYHDFKLNTLYVEGHSIFYFLDDKGKMFLHYESIMKIISLNKDNQSLLKFYPCATLYSDDQAHYISECDLQFLLTEQTSKYLFDFKYRLDILEAFKDYGIMEKPLNKIYLKSRESYNHHALFNSEERVMKCQSYIEEMYKQIPCRSPQSHLYVDTDNPKTLSDYLYCIAYDEALSKTAVGTHVEINGLIFSIEKAE